MATIITSQNFHGVGGPITQTAYQVFTATGSTDWIRFVETDITVQIDGVATAATVVVERTVIDPLSETAFTYAPANSTPMTGNPSTGIPPNIYSEPGLGWWRARVTTLTGGSATVSLVGEGLST